MTDRASGPVLFARYAFPPNHHGYCGPDDAEGFFRSGVAGDDHGLRARARSFDGALPHLQLIADAVDDLTPPDILDPRVVEAYWLGSALLDQVRADRVRPVISAAFAGFIIPLMLRRLKIDPALAGTVVLTTVTDIIGFGVFLGLGTLFLL